MKKSEKNFKLMRAKLSSAISRHNKKPVEIAKKMNVDAARIYRIKAEQSNPTLSTICDLSTAMDVPLSEIFE